ncbi:MAG TPA: zf-HC2 domain-containing protein [Terriglobales bacterium]|nr:zf-HC2 domain-containing protein [Terriglobales bacterium]
MDRLSNILKQRLAAEQVAVEAEHPSADTLTAFAEQGLHAAERQRVLSHLAACPVCRQTVSLATSAEQVTAVALPSRSHSLRFPMALRWASAAATVAVAIGVGVLSYEHQNRPAVTASLPAPTQEKSVAPAAQPAIGQNSEATKSGAKAAHPGRANSQPDIVADASPSKVEPQLKKAQRGAVLGGLVAGSRPTTRFAFPNVADGYMASNKVAPPPTPLPVAPADAKANIFDIAAAPRSAASGAPAAPAQLRLEAQSKAQVETAGSAGKVDKSTFNGPATVSLQQQPASTAEMKSVASSAIGGPVRTRAINAFTPIAHWTISSNGKLQRESGDGRFISIEPAPGVSIRAVAAQGIEVWAAGSQPDLSAKEWQQRPVLFHSSDAGETWTKVEGPWQLPINTLNLDRANVLTVITPDGSWITLDAGKSWKKK